MDVSEVVRLLLFKGPLNWHDLQNKNDFERIVKHKDAK